MEKYLILILICLCSCTVTPVEQDSRCKELTNKYCGTLIEFDNHEFVVERVEKRPNGYFYVIVNSNNKIWLHEKAFKTIINR